MSKPYLPHPLESTTKPRLVNIIATFDVGIDKSRESLDLNLIARTCRNTEYKPKRFSACIMRIRNSEDHKCTALIFSTGKVVVTGAKSEEAAEAAGRLFT